MSFNKLVCLIGLCVLFAGCSTGGYNESMRSTMANESSAKLGERYLLGRGVVQDNAKAFAYFQQAANENDPFAQNEIAFMYAAGKGTTQDYAKSLYWYEKAANHDLASAQYNLGLLYVYGLGTPVNKPLGLEWIRKSAAHDFAPARVALSKFT